MCKVASKGDNLIGKRVFRVICKLTFEEKYGFFLHSDRDNGYMSVMLHGFP